MRSYLTVPDFDASTEVSGEEVSLQNFMKNYKA